MLCTRMTGVLLTQLTNLQPFSLSLSLIILSLQYYYCYDLTNRLTNKLLMAKSNNKIMYIRILNFEFISWSPVFFFLIYSFIYYLFFGEPATQSAGPCNPVTGRDPYFEEPWSSRQSRFTIPDGDFRRKGTQRSGECQGMNVPLSKTHLNHDLVACKLGRDSIKLPNKVGMKYSIQPSFQGQGENFGTIVYFFFFSNLVIFQIFPCK